MSEVMTIQVISISQGNGILKLFIWIMYAFIYVICFPGR